MNKTNKEKLYIINESDILRPNPIKIMRSSYAGFSIKDNLDSESLKNILNNKENWDKVVILRDFDQLEFYENSIRDIEIRVFIDDYMSVYKWEFKNLIGIEKQPSISLKDYLQEMLNNLITLMFVDEFYIFSSGVGKSIIKNIAQKLSELRGKDMSMITIITNTKYDIRGESDKYCIFTKKEQLKNSIRYSYEYRLKNNDVKINAINSVRELDSFSDGRLFVELNLITIGKE